MADDRVPRWVTVSGIVLAVLVLLLLVVALVTGGDHGPGRHTSAGHEPAAGGLAWR